MDNVKGTSGDDTFSTVRNDGTATADTFSSGDSLDGGDGNDTLTLTVTDENATAAAPITLLTSVETVNIRSLDAVDDFDFNAVGLSGTNEIATSNSLASTVIDVLNADKNYNLGAYSSKGTFSVDHTATALTGAADTLNLKISASGTSSADLALDIKDSASFEALSIVASGTKSYVDIDDSSADSGVKTVTITGAGALDVEGDVFDATTLTYNLSGATGGVAITLAGAADVSLTGGSGNDTVRLTDSILSSKDTITGGAGSDTLQVDALTNTTDLTNVSGFETLSVTTTGFDVSVFTPTYTNYVVANSVALTNVTESSTATIEAAAAGTVTFSSKSSSAATQTVKLDGGNESNGFTVNALTSANTGTLNLVSNAATGATANVVTTLNATSATAVNVSGNRALTITNLNTNSDNTATTLNASSLTGVLTVTLDDATAYNITGGSANDSIAFGTSFTEDDSVNGGGGDDTLTINAATSDIGVIKASNIETLALTLGAAGSVDLSSAAIDDVEVTQAGVSSTIQKIQAGTNIILSDVNAGGTLNLDAGNNILTVEAADSLGTLVTGSGDTTLNITSTAASTISTLTGTASLTKVTATGGTALTISAIGTAVNLATIDASGMSANFTLGTNTTRTSTAVVTGGSGADSISMSISDHRNNVIDGGSGTDTLAFYGSQTSNVGEVDLSVTADQVLTINGIANAAVQKGFESVDASAVTAGNGFYITGSSGANTLTGSGLADTISGAAGGDTITGGSGADSLTGGSGADTFVFANTSTSTPSGTNFDVITDYVSATDVIDAGAITIVQSSDAATAAAGHAAVASGVVTFHANDDTLAERIVAVEDAIAENVNGTIGDAAAGDALIFAFGDDSYIFISDATGGVSATDILIKLTGIAGGASTNSLTIASGDITGLA